MKADKEFFKALREEMKRNAPIRTGPSFDDMYIDTLTEQLKSKDIEINKLKEKIHIMESEMEIMRAELEGLPKSAVLALKDGTVIGTLYDTDSLNRDDLWHDIYPDEEEEIREFMRSEMGINDFDSCEYDQKVKFIESAQKLIADHNKIDPRDLPAMVGVDAVAAWADKLPADQNTVALVIRTMIYELFGNSKISLETQKIIEGLGIKRNTSTMHIDQVIGLNNGEVKH